MGLRLSKLFYVAIATAFAVIFSLGVMAEEEYTRDEVEHAYGTDPSRTHYPDTAIDTTDFPNIVLKESARPHEPLRYYEVGPDTYMLYGLNHRINLNFVYREMEQEAFESSEQ